MHNQAVNLTIHLKLQLDLIYNFHWFILVMLLYAEDSQLSFAF